LCWQLGTLLRFLRAPPTAAAARCLATTPLPRSTRQWVPAAQLEAARKCLGTDEDLLLVAMESGGKAQPAAAAPAAASTGGLDPAAAVEAGGEQAAAGSL
jgi:hypothetical protein